ncbi:MAG: adenylate/guanylate cyclase domain-containing protein [Desulfobacteraceae bacterium]|jgi:adenylate cyclase|nr:adenylate/guanylate cyclase domain-containing protein [Desulfobacteraceae bacterium]MBT4365570.1 adenylate/guanylate cyclase domain-containing protein [Desulfobacteraceae bacterium]
MAEKARISPKIKQGLAVGLVSALITLAFWALNWLNVWEAKTWDWRTELLAKPGVATDDIRLILLDQNSLDWAVKENGLTWPWPRELYAVIVNFCQRNGAKALAFDVLFTEPSKYGVSDDIAFSSAAGEFDRFAGAVFLGQTSGSSISWPEEITPSKFKINGISDWLKQTSAKKTSFSRASFPITELAQNTATLCNIHLEPDDDGIYRRVKLFDVFDNNTLPSLGIGTYLSANQHEVSMIQPGRLIIGSKTIPIDKKGNTILRFRGPSGTHKAYSAAAVLQSEIRILNGEAPTINNKNEFKNKYVLFGFTAPGLYDLRSAAVDGVYTGVEIHATMLDNFLSGDFIRHSPVWLVLGLVIFLSIISAILASIFSGLRGMFILCGFLTIPVALSLGSYIYGLWLPLVAPESAVVLSIVLALGVNYATEGRQKRFIKNAFKQYLSPAVIEQLLQNPERLKLGGERKILSIFFSDLQGFTSISEGLDPVELTNLLNDYLSAMTEIIHDEGGTVDKYEGDAIIAFWNAPIDVPDHATRITQAALRCQEKLAELRPAIKEQIGKDMYMRIGINTGLAVVGNMGSQTRFDYTMMGDAVNLAARLEGNNKQFGSYTMMSQYTHQLIADVFPVRELAKIAVVGRREPVTVFEPMFTDEYNSKKKILDEFSKGLDFFYKGQFRQALDIFKAIEDKDPPSAAYSIKCSELIANTPANWEGVWVMTSK